MIVDTFAGPGGWDEALRMLGRSDVIGVEWDKAACDTAATAGHARIWGDVAALDPLDVAAAFGSFSGLIASPPCQAWSMAGKRKGELDRAACHRLADRMADGDDSTDWTEWEDERSPLVCQPVRWVRDLRPEWVALEEVPAVLGLWEHYARIFRAWGYNVWTGVLNAADYGVPQTRQRAILMGHRSRPVAPPVPTHAEHAEPGDLFGGPGRARWVSMAEALGWQAGVEVNTRGDRKTSGGNEFSADRPSWALTGKTRSWFVSAGVTGEGRPKDVDTQPADTLTGKGTAYWIAGMRRDSGPGAEREPRTLGEPSYTIRANGSGTAPSGVEWIYDRPATTVVGSYCPDVIAAPGYRTTESRQNAAGSVRVTVAEAGVLQSFPADYPWQGSKTKRYQQVGNAIPPLLAAHILAALGVGQFATEAAA